MHYLPWHLILRKASSDKRVTIFVLMWQSLVLTWLKVVHNKLQMRLNLPGSLYISNNDFQGPLTMWNESLRNLSVCKEWDKKNLPVHMFLPYSEWPFPLIPQWSTNIDMELNTQNYHCSSNHPVPSCSPLQATGLSKTVILKRKGNQKQPSHPNPGMKREPPVSHYVWDITHPRLT